MFRVVFLSFLTAKKNLYSQYWYILQHRRITENFLLKDSMNMRKAMLVSLSGYHCLSSRVSSGQARSTYIQSFQKLSLIEWKFRNLDSRTIFDKSCIYMYPKNFLFTFPHTGYLIPPELESHLAPYMHDFHDRLLKNFSDWATIHFTLDIPRENFVAAQWSRAVGDPNRRRNAPDIFRETDFGSVPLWKIPITDTQKEHCLRKYYDVYHKEIEHKLEQLLTHHKTVYLIMVTPVVHKF